MSAANEPNADNGVAGVAVPQAAISPAPPQQVPQAPLATSITNHFHITIDIASVEGVRNLQEFLGQAMGVQPNVLSGGANFDAGEGTSGLRPGRVASNATPSRGDIPEEESSDESSVNGNEGRQRASMANHDDVLSDSSLSSDEGARLRRRKSKARQSSSSQSMPLSQDGNGMCVKCKRRLPTALLSCMHVFCEPCTLRMQLKKKPCFRCGKAFRAWKKIIQ